MRSTPLKLARIAMATGAVTIPLSFASLPVHAQSAQGGLEEVVVTARKRAESLQEVPVAISALTADTLQKFDITSIEKVTSMTPQFTVGRASNGSGAQLTMRGIGSSSTSISIEQSVAVIVDDVYYGQGRVINEGMFDMERIEILKGPQALFFGKNATAGAISLTSANPGDDFELVGKVGYELKAEQTYVEVAASGPMTDSLGARLAVRHANMDGGYYSNRSRDITQPTFDSATESITNHVFPGGARDLPGEEELMARLSLVFQPTDNLEMKLKASGTKSTNDNPSWNFAVFNGPLGNVSSLTGAPIGKRFRSYQNDMPAEIAREFPYISDSGRLGNEYESGQVTFAINYDRDNFTISSVTNAQWNENTYACDCDFQSWDMGGNTHTMESSEWEAWSEELRVLTNFDGPLNFMVGVLYQKTFREFDQHIHIGLENSAAPAGYRFHGVHKDSSQEGETLSPFFEVTWAPTDQLTVSAGARYTDESKVSKFVQPYVHPGLQALWLQNSPRVGDQTFYDLSPELTVNYQLTPDTMVYGAYKTAYKSGGFSISGIVGAASTQNDFEFEPETSKGFEFGVKTTLLDDQLRLNATAYYYEFDDLQVDFFNSPSFAFVTLNAGTATTTGLELDGQFAPFAVPGLTLSGSLNYNKAEYDDFIAPCWSGQKPSQGCNTVVPGTAGTPGTDLSGKPTSMAPEWTASLGIDYELPVFGDLLLGFSANLLYSDDYNPSGFANPYSAMDSYTKLDASVRFGAEDKRWEVALIGRNLTNEFVVNGVLDGANTGAGTGTEAGVPADQVGFAGMPRAVALQFTGRY